MVSEEISEALVAVDVQDKETWLKGLSGCFLKARKRRSLYCWSLRKPKPRERVSCARSTARRRAYRRPGKSFFN